MSIDQEFSISGIQRLGVSYNQPKLSPWATWNSTAITFANNESVGFQPHGLFVHSSDAVYVCERSLNRAQVWPAGNMLPARNISGGLTEPFAIFVAVNGDVYIDNGGSNHRVDMWTPNSTSSVPVMLVEDGCHGLFVDIYESIYCSIDAVHKVTKKSFNDPANTTTIIAGTGVYGPAAYQLTHPRGIFVDIRLNLYVADCSNARIQFFAPGQFNGIPLLGTGASGTISLDNPSDVVLDADGRLYVIDSNGQRIVGWGPGGYQCIAACHTYAGSGPEFLDGAFALSFDSHGNIFCRRRIQRPSTKISYYQERLR